MMMRFKSIVQPFKILLYGLLGLTAILSIGILFWWNYPLELFCNFRVYYLLLACGLAAAFGIYHLKGYPVRRALLLSLALIAFNSVWIAPWYLSDAQRGSGDTIRVLTFNINVANTEWDAIAQAIRTVKPDIATIVESNVESKRELSKRLSAELPYVYRTSGGGFTILSRFSLVSPESKTFTQGTVLKTGVQINQKVVQVVAVHPIVPVKPTLFKRRNAFLGELTTYLQQQPQNALIVLGDFNLTPWSPYYSQLISKTGLHNTRLGFGVEPSWIEPASYVRHPNWITALVKIPIDHILVTSDIQVSDCQTKKAANSDHRMLWSDIILPPTS